MSQANWFLKLRKSIVVSSSSVNISTREYWFSNLSRIVGHQIFSNVMSHHRRRNFLPCVSPSLQSSEKPRNTSPPDASSKRQISIIQKFRNYFHHFRVASNTQDVFFPARLCTINLFNLCSQIRLREFRY
jgi:hypothetical protein